MSAGGRGVLYGPVSADVEEERNRACSGRAEGACASPFLCNDCHVGRCEHRLAPGRSGIELVYECEGFEANCVSSVNRAHQSELIARRIRYGRELFLLNL